ncbi:WRKY_transcription factor 4 [Hexamita inflata]|uniref:Putative n=1 Tax=Hexamita inflata TaxID=28002 RepID=A0AA86VUN4_9EUKA|nr:WRKY transcription factor 4 [Hexamita inflata]CAI9978973.1 WRKY transcription factor 4 [Hexamita inflata]
MDDPLSNLFSELLPRLKQLQTHLKQNGLTDNLNLIQMIQIGQQIHDQNRQKPLQCAEFNLKYRDIQPDGYVWRKYGQKPDGKCSQKSYFKCTFPGCQAKRLVSINRESGEVANAYNGTHNHQKNNVIVVKANSYEEYLVLSARVQQFEAQSLFNGYGEQIDPIRDSSQISSEFPLKISVKQCEFQLDTSQLDQPYQAHIIIDFACEQEFPSVKTQVNPLTDPKQQLVYDGFVFNRYGLKKSETNASLYLRCCVPRCPCVKRIDLNGKKMKVIFENTHNHHPSQVFCLEKYVVCLGNYFKYDKQQQMLINVSNRKTDNYENYDYEEQGVLNALTQYANTEEKQKTDNLMDIYNLGQEREPDDEEEAMRHLFPHL